ncbi:MAG TPA: methyltransferase domain-containing protein [Polyangia bacterium]|jgi:sterol 24-C-methyltransferase|nr:methyltransferase domain-containing protein [Polyangia bacterium]
MNKPMFQEFMKSSLGPERVQQTVETYRHLHSERSGGDVDARKANYAKMVNHYYDMVTDFYEYGWGQSFHFAPRHRRESFEASLARYEMFIALRLGLKPGMKAIDIGCGVGGPMRAIARFSGARVVGLNNNDYQVQRARRHNEEAGLAHLCEVMKGDFMNLPAEDNTFDAAYEIEATCHAPDRVRCFSEIRRVLKPGGLFAGYEWALTDKYDPNNAEHRDIKKGIEEGTGLPDLAYIPDILKAFEQAGFEIVSSHDHAHTADPETPWWDALVGKWYTPTGFPRTPAGRWMTNRILKSLETFKVAPSGATEVSSMLNYGADALVRGGQTGIFTPMLFHLVRKPG